MRKTAATLMLALAIAMAGVPGHADAQLFAFTRGSHFANGSSELIVPTLTVPQGTELVLVNLHVWGHSITSDAWAVPNRLRLFRSEVIPFGESSVVRGVDSLAPGTYGFFCSNHMGMRGTLIVV